MVSIFKTTHGSTTQNVFHAGSTATGPRSPTDEVTPELVPWAPSFGCSLWWYGNIRARYTHRENTIYRFSVFCCEKSWKMFKKIRYTTTAKLQTFGGTWSFWLNCHNHMGTCKWTWQRWQFVWFKPGCTELDLRLSAGSITIFLPTFFEVVSTTTSLPTPGPARLQFFKVSRLIIRV